LWDEWFLTFDDDRPGWLVEDEGDYTFFHKLPSQVMCRHLMM
jgi:hypothetical protein